MISLVLGLTGPCKAGSEIAANHLANRHHFLKLSFTEVIVREVCPAWGVTSHLFTSPDSQSTPSLALRIRRCKNSDFILWFLEHEQGARTCEPHQGWLGLLDQPQKPEWILRSWQNWRMYGNDSYYTDQLQHVIDCHPHHSVVVSDITPAPANHRNSEALFIHRQPAAELWHVDRTGIPASEMALRVPSALIDRYLSNLSTLENLCQLVDLHLGNWQARVDGRELKEKQSTH